MLHPHSRGLRHSKTTTLLEDSVNGRFGFVSAETGGATGVIRRPRHGVELLNGEANEIDPNDADPNPQISLVIGAYVITEPLATYGWLPWWCTSRPLARRDRGQVQVSGAGDPPGVARVGAPELGRKGPLRLVVDLHQVH